MYTVYSFMCHLKSNEIFVKNFPTSDYQSTIKLSSRTFDSKSKVITVQKNSISIYFTTTNPHLHFFRNKNEFFVGAFILVQVQLKSNLQNCRNGKFFENYA